MSLTKHQTPAGSRWVWNGNYLGKELSFPRGVFLMTGTGIVPPESFSLQAGDTVVVKVGECSLSNPVTR
jgi:2-dehydro-3-deoxy-D-arabinonate dehydratase